MSVWPSRCAGLDTLYAHLATFFTLPGANPEFTRTDVWFEVAGTQRGKLGLSGVSLTKSSPLVQKIYIFVPVSF